ncbi:Uu.00g129380.m01.CDS01 [Anthostomella pinea]|uniref:Uu.00g129380.m01.CDS01 n=1 Tax=Anthostomella pinea TaxID=933095 RepID=A0AAI8VJL8_9PEZI|nr:Uu.00g129380.m01.CDS01 [Anthostomella pinea]
MKVSTLKTVLITLSCLGLFLLWGVMALQGSLQALFEIKDSAVFPNGRRLKTSYTGIGPVDNLLCILVIFFDGLNNLVEPAQYLMLLELVSTLFVINMMTLVESRRPVKPRWARSPTLWQFLWNCGGVAVFLPIYSLLYIKQGPNNSVPLPAPEAQALPFTALWGLLLAIPLMTPALIDAAPFRTQDGVALFFLAIPAFSGFQYLASFVISKINYRGAQKPVQLAYRIVGTVSGLVHVGIVTYALTSDAANTSLFKIFILNHSAVQNDSDIMTQAALLFIQSDYVIITVVVVLLGIYTWYPEPVSGGKATADGQGAAGSLIKLVGVMSTLGAGAGLAFVLHDKEGRKAPTRSSKKRLH